MPWALIGAVGCSKIDRSREAGGTAGQLSGVSAASLKLSDFEKACLEVPGMDKMPVLVNVAAYPLLVEFAKQISPFLKNDSSRFVRAHASALRATNEHVMHQLRENSKAGAYTAFKQRVQENIRYERPNPATDLQTMLNKVMELSEGSRCGGAYLSHFYARFVKELDPFGSLTIGLTEERTSEDTLHVNHGLPDEIRLAPPTRIQSYTAIVTIPVVAASPVVRDALSWLERGHTSREYNVVLLDLRYASGLDISILTEIRASAARGWGTRPLVFWVNRETRGSAAVLVQSLSSLPNVMVVSEDDETYGYGRKLAQRSIELMPGLSPLTLTMCSEQLQAPTLDPDREGYRVQIRQENQIIKATMEKVLERAVQWDTQAQKIDAGMILAKNGTRLPNDSVRLTASGEPAPPQAGDESVQSTPQPEASAAEQTNPFAQEAGPSPSATAPSPFESEYVGQDMTVSPGH